MRFDRFDNLKFLSLNERYGRIVNAGAIPNGVSYGYVVGAQQPTYTLTMAMADVCSEDLRKRFVRFRELIENPNFKWHYVQFDIDEIHNDGFYTASNLSVVKNDTVIEFAVDIQRIGGVSERRPVTNWDANDEDYSGWATLVCNSLVTLPYSVTRVAWTVTGTRTGDDGSNQYLINPTRQAIMYSMPSAGGAWYRAECKAWDVGNGDLADKSTWARVLAPSHNFDGVRVFENGIIKYVLNITTGTFHFYSSNTSAWTSMGELRTALTGNADATIARSYIMSISSEEIKWREIRQYEDNPILLDFTMRRGCPFVRVELTTFSLGIDTGTYVQILRPGGYTQMFNSAASGNAGGGDLAQDATNNYIAGYTGAADFVTAFVLTDQPTQQPYDSGAGDYLAESNTWAVGSKRVFFVAAWAQETNPFDLALGRINALAIARQCMSNVKQSWDLTSEYYV